MGWLTKFLARRVGDRIYHQLSEAAKLVQVATYQRLRQRYACRYGYEQEFARRLASAVSGELFAMRGDDQAHEAFREANVQLIEDELEALKVDQELRTAVTFSLLAMMNVRLFQLGFPDATKLDRQAREELVGPYEHLRRRGLADETVADPNPDTFLPLVRRYYRENTSHGADDAGTAQDDPARLELGERKGHS